MIWLDIIDFGFDLVPEDGFDPEIEYVLGIGD